MTEPESATDPRPVWNPDTSLPAVRKAFAEAAGGLGSADPEMLPHLLSPLVATFHMQIGRLQEELEISRRALSELPANVDRSGPQAEIAAIEEKIGAFTQIADTAKEEYERHTGHPWEPHEEDEYPAPEEPEPLHDAPAPAAAAAPSAEGRRDGEADPQGDGGIPF